jgi:hypothetical protein
MHILFLSCLKATELIEKKLHFKLSLTEKLQLKVHKMMCNACSNYEKQNLIIEESIANQENANNNQIDVEQFKVSILEKLSK